MLWYREKGDLWRNVCSISRLCWTAYGATEDEMMDFGEIYLFTVGTFRLWSIAIVNHYRLVLIVLVSQVKVVVG